MSIITKLIGGACAVFALFVILIFAFGSWGTINAGARGVVLRMGAVTGEVKGEGFYTKTPWLETVVQWYVQVRKEEVATEAASKDLQMVTTKVALNVNIDPSKVAHIYQTYGGQCYTTFVDPALRESMKAIIAQYTAEELITKREVVREAIATLVATKLSPAGFVTDAVNITDFHFSPQFDSAIESKMTAQQNALAAQNKLAQIKFEADQARSFAQGKADAMAIESKALQSSPQILELRALEKWDGKLPTVMGGGTVPFINVGALGAGASK